MQDEVNSKTVAMSINTAKMTTKVLANMIKDYLDVIKNKTINPNIKTGKQTVKQLAKQNQGMTSVAVGDKNIKMFERYARKHGIDFALKKDNSEKPPKYTVFFKGRDQDAIISALEDFSKGTLQKANRESVVEKLDRAKQKIKDRKIDQVKTKTKSEQVL